MTVQTDEDGAYEVERRLSDFVVKPVLYKGSERMRSRMGKLSIKGIQVETSEAVTQAATTNPSLESLLDVASQAAQASVERTPR